MSTIIAVFREIQQLVYEEYFKKSMGKKVENKIETQICNSMTRTKKIF